MTKYIFITGVSTGIGRASINNLANEGYFVIGTVRSEKDKKMLEAELPRNTRILICDICSDNQINDAILELEKILDGKPLYALVNNAGIAIPGPMHMISDEEFEKQLQVNLVATRKLTNKLIPYLKSSDTLNPRIIFISSISGIFAAPFNGSYCVSKHALECLSDIYRRELKYIGIDVVVIQPGPIKTQIWKKAQGKFDRYKKGAFTQIAERADMIISETEKTALDVSKVTDRISSIMKSNKNRNRYLIHKRPILFRIVAYYLPSKWVDKMIWKNLDKTDGKKYRPV